MDIASPTARRSLREPISALALFAGGLAWIAAFWLPAFYTSQGPVEGYWVFATGWMGFAIFQFAWYANLFMLLGIVLMYTSPLWGSALAGFAVLVATQAFWFNSIPTGEVEMPILQLGKGFWCWYSSIVLLGVGVFLGSEQIEAEKNQTTKQTSRSTLQPKVQKIQADEPEFKVLVNSAVAAPIFTPVVEPIYEAVMNTQVEPVVAKMDETLPELSLVLADTSESMPEPEVIKPTPFALVPEPEAPDFAELTAANEQEYFQIAEEVALKPVYNEHLAEDWPPKMSLVVASDPFTTQPNLEVQAEPIVIIEPAKQAVNAVPTQAEVKSTTSFFDPWQT